MSTDTPIKLTYFDARVSEIWKHSTRKSGNPPVDEYEADWMGARQGRAEATRLALVISETAFEDVRFPAPEWPSIKPTTPYGSVPVLQHGDVSAAQSNAILRYVGKLTGMYPEDAVAALKVDETIETMADISATIVAVVLTKDVAPEERDHKLRDAITRYWGGMAKRIAGWSPQGPYVLGDQISIADLAVLSQLLALKKFVPDVADDALLGQFPRMQMICDAVLRIPQVVEWHKKHALPDGVVIWHVLLWEVYNRF